MMVEQVAIFIENRSGRLAEPDPVQQVGPPPPGRGSLRGLSARRSFE